MASDDEQEPIFVPKRFGLGETLNFRRPVAWVILAGIILASLALGIFFSHGSHSHH